MSVKDGDNLLQVRFKDYAFKVSIQGLFVAKKPECHDKEKGHDEESKGMAYSFEASSVVIEEKNHEKR